MAYTAKTDLTKKALADSLKKAMAVKPINKITIRELVEDSGLNRQTFYYHFQDIYDLLEWMLDQEIVSTLTESEYFLSWQDAGIYLLKYIQSNEAISHCLINSVGTTTLKKYIYSDALEIAQRFLRYAAQGIDVSERDFIALAHYYSITFSALLEDWVSRGMKSTPEEMIDVLDTIVSGTAKQALLRFAERNKEL